MNYNQTLSNLRDAIADIQTALNNIGLDGSQSMAGWAEQLETVSSTLQGLRDQISADDTDFSNIYDAIVQKGQSPDEEDRDTYAPAILAISGVLDTLNVTPSTQAQSITPPAGTDGYNSVNVSAVDASIDSNIQAGNIKSEVEILGVVGNYSGGLNYQSKSVTPTAAGLTVTPDTGYDALSSVVIAGDQQLIASNIKKDVEIFGVTGILEGGSGVSVNPHPTSLAYAGCGEKNSLAHSDILPADGSWTTAVDLTNLSDYYGFRHVFYNNTTISSLDLRNWNFENITDVRNAFYGCSNLVTIQGTLRLDKCTTYLYTFALCSSLITCGITNFGFGTTTTTITLDLSASAVLDAHTMIQNFETNNSGKTRILKLHADVLAGLSSEDTALAASKNITLQ